MKQTFYFNTGVKPWNSTYLADGDKFINNERHVPFICEDVPEGAIFQHGAQTDDLKTYNPKIKPFKIIGGNLLSEYAYFLIP